MKTVFLSGFFGFLAFVLGYWRLRRNDDRHARDDMMSTLKFGFLLFCLFFAPHMALARDIHAIPAPLAALAGYVLGFFAVGYFTDPQDRPRWEEMPPRGLRGPRMLEIMREQEADGKNRILVAIGIVLFVLGMGVLFMGAAEILYLGFTAIFGAGAIIVWVLIFPSDGFHVKLEKIYKEFPELADTRHTPEEIEEIKREVGPSALPDKTFAFLSKPRFPGRRKPDTHKKLASK